MNISRISLFIVLTVFSGCAHAGNRDAYQISTIGALMRGVYEGAVECGQLKKKGDFGIGTYDGLDGEMIETEGKFYKVKTDGIAYPVKDTEKVPFAVTLFFRPDQSIRLPENLNYSKVLAYLDTVLPEKNMIYAVKISGEFLSVKTRSVPQYQKPYPPLLEAVKNQKVFELKNVRGTLIGFRFPAYMEGINVPGYHLHFLTEDRKAGGHVLDFKAGALEASTEEARSLTVELPTSQAFRQADLMNASAGVAVAEKNS